MTSLGSIAESIFFLMLDNGSARLILAIYLLLSLPTVFLGLSVPEAANLVRGWTDGEFVWCKKTYTAVWLAGK